MHNILSQGLWLGIALAAAACGSSEEKGLDGASVSTGGGDASAGDAAGTGGDAQEPGSTNPAATNAALLKECDERSAVVCSKLRSCNSIGLAAYYADEETCRQRMLLDCKRVVSAQGTSLTAEKMAACTRDVAAIACDNFGAYLVSQRTGACATLPGSLQDGQSCVDDAQCKSTFCARNAATPCGICSAPTRPGAPCVHKACSQGTHCNGVQCVGFKAGKAGDACTGQQDCDFFSGVVCNTLTHVCIKAVVSTDNRCGFLAADTSVYYPCPASGKCSSSLNGSCSPATADNQMCTVTESNLDCMPPAICAGGRCVVPDHSMCK